MVMNCRRENYLGNWMVIRKRTDVSTLKDWQLKVIKATMEGRNTVMIRRNTK